MIIGIGVDIVSIKRIESLVLKLREKFEYRILTEIELTYYYDLNSKARIYYLAKRYAAKEAVSKALGTGISKQLSFKNICILNNSIKKPYINLMGKAEDLAKSLNINRWHISISDEQGYAIAYVIGENYESSDR